jgi:single-strand DNA-binding protein
MANDAQVTLCGYVAKEPAFKTLASGASFANFRIAFTERRRNRQTGEWSDGDTTFLGVKCFRTLAENVVGSLHKGEPVMVRGRLFTRKFTGADGQERSEMQVDASSVGHDLSRGVAIFSRTRKAARGSAPGGDGAAASLATEEAELGGNEGGPAQALDHVDEDAVDAAVADAEDVQAGGDAVVDEDAVAEFAKEIEESLPGEPAAAVS